MAGGDNIREIVNVDGAICRLRCLEQSPERKTKKLLPRLLSPPSLSLLPPLGMNIF